MSNEAGKKKYLIVGGILAGLVAVIAILVWIGMSSGEKDMYNTTQISVVEGTIENKEIEDGSYYIGVAVSGSPNSPYYVASTPEFFNSSAVGQRVGIVLGSVDTYKVKTSRDKKQLSIQYSSTAWEGLSLYPSLDQALKENSFVSFTTMATLVQRIHSLDGRYFFLMDAGGKKVMAEVGKEYYERFNPATVQPNSFELAFEGYGDFNHLSGIVNPQ